MNLVAQTPPVKAHALLSASGSKKWLECNLSAQLEAQFADAPSLFSREGELAHDVGELRLLHLLSRITDQEFNQRYEALKSSPYWSEELDRCVQLYVDFAIEQITEAKAECPDAVIKVEERVNFSAFVPEGFGTVDLLLARDGLLVIADYKHGKGVFVKAQGNSQMRLYGLGGLTEFGHLYDIQRVRMTICQPRLDNFASEEISVEELLEWGQSYVRPRAQLAWAGQGSFVPGSHCTEGFCKARFTCAARAEAAMEVAEAAFTPLLPDQLTTEDLVAVLSKADLAAKWLSDVREYALQQALKGTAIPGFKLVAGKSQRRYRDADKVAKRLEEAGISPALIYERNLLGITALERALGKKKVGELLPDLIEKPMGQPALVPTSDPRSALELNFGFSALTDDGSCDRFAAITHQE